MAQVLCQLDRDGVRERYGPRLPALRLGDKRMAEELDLLLDVESVTQEVDVADSEPERLALSKSAPGCHDAHGSIPLGERVDDRFHLFDRPRLHLLRVDGWSPHRTGTVVDVRPADGTLIARRHRAPGRASPACTRRPGPHRGHGQTSRTPDAQRPARGAARGADGVAQRAPRSPTPPPRHPA